MRADTCPDPPLLLLASSSQRRRELITLLGLPFQAIPADVDETPLPGESPTALAARLALAKARVVNSRYPQAVVVGCDTVVALDGEALGKPTSVSQAQEMLERLCGRTHVVTSGLAVVGEGREVVLTVDTAVRMRRYSRAEMDAYIASGDPFDKAGAYAIQDPTFRPVASWEGCYANVAGFPLCHVAHALREWALQPTSDLPALCQAHLGQRCAIFSSRDFAPSVV